MANRYKRFLFSSALSSTRLKPGVNEK